MWLYGFGDLVCLGNYGCGFRGYMFQGKGLGFGGHVGASEGELRQGILE